MRVRKSLGNDQQMADRCRRAAISLPFHSTNSYATDDENQEPPPCKKPVIGLYSHTHAHTCIATQVYDLKSGYVGGPGLLKSRV